MIAIQNNAHHIRHDGNISQKLKWTEGSVSTATVDLLHLINFGLRQLKSNTEKHGYRNINLPSCMTLPLENLH